MLFVFGYYYVAVTNGYWPFEADQTSGNKGEFGHAFGALTSLFKRLTSTALTYVVDSAAHRNVAKLRGDALQLAGGPQLDY